MMKKSNDDTPDAEFELWRVYDAGGPVLSLKIRYREGVQQPDWQAGPDLPTALTEAAAHGWNAYDREPGDAPGEYAIIHLVRHRRPDRPSS